MEHNNAFFSVEKRKTSVTYWRCTDRSCRGRLVETENIVERGTHTCDPEKERSKFLAKQLVKDVDQDVRRCYQPVPRKVSSQLSTTYRSNAVCLPSKTSLNKRVYRLLKKDNIVIPATQDFVVPLSLHQLPNDESTIKLDFTLSGQRIIACSTNVLLEILARSTVICGDGTFGVTPRPFAQVYIFHAFKNEFHVPCLFVLLNNKSRNTYIELLRQLKDLLHQQFNIDFAPSQIVIDFEQAMLSALSSELPSSDQCGCYFHQTDAVNRNISKLGLKIRIWSNKDLFTIVKMTTSLAYLPVTDISPAFSWLEASAAANYTPLAAFFKYFRRQWLDSISPSIWSVNARAFTTNNYAEGFNNKLDTKFGRVKHQGLSIFFSKIREILLETEIDVARQDHGAEPPSRPGVKQRMKNRRIDILKNELSQKRISVPFFLFKVADVRCLYKKRKCVPFSTLKLFPFSVSPLDEQISSTESNHPTHAVEANSVGIVDATDVIAAIGSPPVVQPVPSPVVTANDAGIMDTDSPSMQQHSLHPSAVSTDDANIAVISSPLITQTVSPLPAAPGNDATIADDVGSSIHFPFAEVFQNIAPQSSSPTGGFYPAIMQTHNPASPQSIYVPSMPIASAQDVHGLSDDVFIDIGDFGFTGRPEALSVSDSEQNHPRFSLLSDIQVEPRPYIPIRDAVPTFPPCGHSVAVLIEYLQQRGTLKKHCIRRLNYFRNRQHRGCPLQNMDSHVTELVCTMEECKFPAHETNLQEYFK